MNKTVEMIKGIIEEEKFEFYGLRADERDYEIGEITDCSHQLYQDPWYVDYETEELLYPYIEEGPYEGFYDGGELNGTCALKVTSENVAEILGDIRKYGTNIYLIASNCVEDGEDMGEIIMEDAEVLAHFTI